MTSDNYRTARHRGSQDAYDYEYPGERLRQQPSYPTMSSVAGTDPSNKTRARAQSRSSESSQPQRYRDVVNPSFERSDSLNQVPPDLVAQITEQVINNLKLNGIGSSAPPSSTQPAPQSSSNAHSSAIPSRNIHTPPSPERYGGSFVSSASSEDDTRMGGRLDGTYEKEVSPKHTDKLPVPAKPMENLTRPKPVERSSTGNTASTLEKIWQPLFDANGNATPRLGQFLRGVAIHIIEDFEPHQSIVVTPAKMAAFYEKVKLASEIYPWADIFGAKMTNSSLSHLYRDLQCEHHFTQAQFHERPSIPGLTPLGFERWMTYVIQAHPDLEFERFSKAVLDMAISNADNKQERFPKQLSRRLFPQAANKKVKLELEDAILTDPVIKLHKGTSSSHATAASGQPNAMPAPIPSLSKKASVGEGERRGVAFTDSAVGDAPPAIAIERERKPYTSQGAGKMYDQSDVRESRADGPDRRASVRPAAEATEGYSERSQPHRPGSQAGAPPTRRRNRSPAASKEHRRSENDVGDGMHGAGMGSHLHGESDDEARRSERERSRRHGSAEERGRGGAKGGGGGGGYEEDGTSYRRGSVHASYVYPPPPPRYGGS